METRFNIANLLPNVPVWQTEAVKLNDYFEHHQRMNKSQRFEFVERMSCNQSKQRADALVEIESAFFLERIHGYPIHQWKVKVAENAELEFTFVCGGIEVDCEVKRPSWKANIVDALGKDAPRLSEPKYSSNDPEIRFRKNPGRVIFEQMQEACEKLSPERPSLLVINDDLWGYDTCDFLRDMTLNNVVDRLHWSSDHENLGGVLCLKLRLNDESGTIVYDFEFERNPNPRSACRLPHGLFTATESVSPGKRIAF